MRQPFVTTWKTEPGKRESLCEMERVHVLATWSFTESRALLQTRAIGGGAVSELTWTKSTPISTWTTPEPTTTINRDKTGKRSENKGQKGEERAKIKRIWQGKGKERWEERRGQRWESGAGNATSKAIETSKNKDDKGLVSSKQWCNLTRSSRDLFLLCAGESREASTLLVSRALSLSRERGQSIKGHARGVGTDGVGRGIVSSLIYLCRWDCRLGSGQYLMRFHMDITDHGSGLL